jgi:hypothetical protein
MAIRSLLRPQTGWENDVKNDLNIMKIYNWKDCIQDRHKWKKKSLRRPKHSIIEVVAQEEEVIPALTDVLDYLYHPERDGMSFRILYLFLKKF